LQVSGYAGTACEAEADERKSIVTGYITSLSSDSILVPNSMGEYNTCSAGKESEGSLCCSHEPTVHLSLGQTNPYCSAMSYFFKSTVIFPIYA
jgi:hypothetical protein